MAKLNRKMKEGPKFVGLSSGAKIFKFHDVGLF